MNFFEKILEGLDGKMETPTMYGWFHLLSLAVVIGLIVLVVFKCKNISEKTFRIIILSTAIGLIIFEIYKQLNFSYNPSTDTWDYQWYAFPYQFCSTPIFVLPFVAFLKDSKFRDAFVAYMAFFSLFGGIAVFFYPNDVFISTVGVNIQTMFHHGMQIVLGIFLTVHNRRKLSLEYFARSVAVFGMFVAIAIIMNFAVYHALVGAGMDDTFNMFYISPYFDCTLPVLSGVYSDVIYPVFIVIYILGFAFVAFLMYLIQSGIAQLAKKGIGLHAHQH